MKVEQACANTATQTLPVNMYFYLKYKQVKAYSLNFYGKCFHSLNSREQMLLACTRMKQQEKEFLLAVCLVPPFPVPISSLVEL